MPYVKYVKMSPLARVPEYATEGSAGMDAFALFTEGENYRASLHPGEGIVVGTGLRVEIPPGYEMQVRPRSGLASRGLLIPNSPGTIDSDYRGELRILVLNASQNTIQIASGDRIAQLVMAPVTRAVFVEADSLSETARGSCGFGSTGR